MPYVNVQILRGATPAQKRQVVRDITSSLVTVLGKSPEHVHIVIDEIDPLNWGYAGDLTAFNESPPATKRTSARPTS